MMIQRPDRLLFVQGDLRQMLDARRQRMLTEIGNADAAQLSNIHVDRFLSERIAEWRAEPLKIHDDRVAMTPHETSMSLDDFGRQLTVPATAFVFRVPFSGDPTLFQCRPSTYSTGAPQATIERSELRLTFVVREPNAQALEQAFRAELADIQRYVDWINADLAGFNKALRTDADAVAQSRRDHLGKISSVADQLGYPRA